MLGNSSLTKIQTERTSPQVKLQTYILFQNNLINTAAQAWTSALIDHMYNLKTTW